MTGLGYLLWGAGTALIGLAAIAVWASGRKVGRKVDDVASQIRPPSSAASPGALIEASAVDAVQLRRELKAMRAEHREIRDDLRVVTKAILEHIADGHGPLLSADGGRR